MECGGREHHWRQFHSGGIVRTMSQAILDPAQSITLSAGEIKYYRDEGFLLIPGLIAAETAQALRDEVMHVFEQHGTTYQRLCQGLDAGDKLRVVVFGQEGLTNTYAIDAGGSITMPLIGAVPARGQTPAGLAAAITAKLRNGYIREPSVAVEVETYRPFFILGEVAAPGQYPYVPNMSVESAVAIAGGFSPRAKRDHVTLTHTDNSGPSRTVVPLGTPISPGDTVLVGERWFYSFRSRLDQV